MVTLDQEYLKCRCVEISSLAARSLGPYEDLVIDVLSKFDRLKLPLIVPVEGPSGVTLLSLVVGMRKGRVIPDGPAIARGMQRAFGWGRCREDWNA